MQTNWQIIISRPITYQRLVTRKRHSFFDHIIRQIRMAERIEDPETRCSRLTALKHQLRNRPDKHPAPAL